MDKCKKYPIIKPKNIPKTLKDISIFCNMLRSNKVKDSKAKFLSLPLIVQCIFLYHGWQVLSNRKKYTDDSYLTSFRLFKLFRNKEMQSKKTFKKYADLDTLDKYYKQALNWNRKLDSEITSKVWNYEEDEEGNNVMDLVIEDYSAKAFVVRGDSRPYKKELLEMNGKYGRNFGGQPGWVFSKKRKKQVEEFISSGKVQSKKSNKRTTSSTTRVPKKKTKYDKEYQRYKSPSGELDPTYLYYTSMYAQDPKSRLSITWLTEHGVYDGSERKKLVKKYEKLVKNNKIIR